MQQALQETRQQGTPLHPLKIYCMDQRAARIDVPYHWQETIEILWLQQGQLRLRIGETVYAGRQGDIFYINPRELHSMQGQSADCRYYALVFPLSWLGFAQPDEVNELYLKPLLENTAGVVNRLPCQTAEQAARLLEELVNWYYGREAGAWLGIKANLLRFYHCVYQNGLVQRKVEGVCSQAEALWSISRYIQQHSGEKLSLQRLGAEFHMSAKYFSVYFQRHFDRGFSDYLTAVRMEQAKSLLARTDQDIEWIAEQCGFSAGSYFIRIFRQTQGMTPGRYRKMFRPGTETR